MEIEYWSLIYAKKAILIVFFNCIFLTFIRFPLREVEAKKLSKLQNIEVSEIVNFWVWGSEIIVRILDLGGCYLFYKK